MPAPYYVSTDPTGRWVGSGVRLTAAQADENIWYFADAISGITGATAVSIGSITQTGTNLYVNYTDSSQDGPFPIPTATWSPQGEWTALTAYSQNDIIYYNGQVYLVLENHTSDSTFDENATDGDLNLLYGLLVPVPGNTLPSGGTAGYVLTKNTATDFDISWTAPLPTGGATGSRLVKASSTNFDVQWSAEPTIFNVVTGTTGIGTATIGPTAGNIYQITPTGDLTINASSAPVGPVYFVFTTTGATARNITFGTNMTSSGVVTTGTVAAKKITAQFIGDGSALTEISVSGAM